MRTILISIDNCPYFSPYQKGYDLLKEGGDCDLIEGPGKCDPDKCPINESLKNQGEKKP